MPRAPRICGRVDCAHLVERGSYCPEHARPAWQGRNAERTESARRTGTRKFNQTIRPAVLKRDHYTCQLQLDGCRATQPVTADRLEVDHIVQCVDDGSDELTNLRTTCRPCHRQRSTSSAAAEFFEPSPRSRRRPTPAPKPIGMPFVIQTHCN